MATDKRGAVVIEAGAMQVKEFEQLVRALSDEDRRFISELVRELSMGRALRGAPAVRDERLN